MYFNIPSLRNVFVFLVIFPYLSPKAPWVHRTTTSNSICSKLDFITARGGLSLNFIPNINSMNISRSKNLEVYSGFADGLYNGHVKDVTREENRHQKQRQGRRRVAKKKLRSNRRLLPLRQIKRNKSTVKRIHTGEQNQNIAKQKIMQKVLDELQSHSRYQNSEETCATRYARNIISDSNAKFHPYKTYGSLIDSSLTIDSRNRRHVTGSINEAQEPSVAYFTGNTLLRRKVDLISDLFTVELWVNPEGGQKDPAVIVACYRTMEGGRLESVWNLGIKSNDDETVFYFSLIKSTGTVTAYSPYAYKPEEWTHFTVSSGEDGTIRLYVNGVQVGARHEPGSGELSRQGAQCDTLLLGGNEKMTHGYRGMIDQLKIFSQIRPQQDITRDMYNFETSHLTDIVQLKEDFDSFRHSWLSIGRNEPIILNKDIPSEDRRLHFPEVRAPPCGQTICDNPEIVRSYVDNWTLRKPKTLRYNIVNINQDDGSNPMFTVDDVKLQSAVLSEVFDRHNITWVPTLVHINNSKLRGKTIGCEPTKIGNQQCNVECMHARLGYDGGDCDLIKSVCSPEQKGDGHCDPECNKIYHSWDLGDCCIPNNTNTDDTCFDPKSPHRGYLCITEYKALVGADNEKQLNVLFANWTNPNSIGISTFPWDKEVFTSQGGTVVQLKRYTTREEMSGLVHELGHNLGLLHVHHGSHNVDCDDSCAELRASMITGDLCEDTNPTPMNMYCGEPNGSQAVCSIHNFTMTPYTNFMSYADGSCQDNFTPQQRGRMHCYIDLVYGEWRTEHVISPIPIPPKIVSASASDRTVVISWAPPIDGRLVGNDRKCDSRCLSDKMLRQYGFNASSSEDMSLHRRWSAEQATGPPDQEACTLRGMHFWMPPDTTTLDDDCGARCSLEVDFKESVIPSTIRIWVTFGTEDGDGIKSIELIHHEDNTVTTITDLTATCDTPLSVHVQTNKPTRKIRINVNYPYTAVDAVELISKKENNLCAGCRRIKYKIHRDPPFPNELTMTTEQLHHVDKSCEDGVTYLYSIQPILLPHYGEISPPVKFRLGQTFCGDGIVQELNSNEESEECDDSNMENEDGCNSFCQIEHGFYCKGEPSICYWYDEDGICEEFEEPNSIDCKIEATKLYLQQWAVDATSSSAALEAHYLFSNMGVCSSSTSVTGPPDSACGSQNGVWSPCVKHGLSVDADGHWIKVVYRIPVIPSTVTIYTNSREDETRQEEFTLLLPYGEEISSGSTTIYCLQNQIEIEIPDKQNPQKIKDFILKFSSDNVTIDAISLSSMRNHEELPAQIPVLSECRLDLNFVNFNVTCHTETGLSVDASAGNTLPNKTICDVVCNPGHIPRSIQRVRCRNGAWDSSVKCIPISCGPPSHVQFASFSCQNGHKLNAICNFTCWRQARLFGSDNKFQCQNDGTWSTPSAYCEPMCGAPPNIGFATAGCDTLSKRASRPGETCKYRCKNGYHVTQQPLLRRTFRLTCGSNGVWEGPGCQPALCPPVPQIYKGLYKCTQGFVYGSECTMSCNPSESATMASIRCDSNGKWNASFPMCANINTTCQFPLAPPGIEIACDGYNTGQTCRARCVLKDGLPAFDIVAMNDKSVLPEPNRKSKLLVCLGDSWFPKPDQLYCVDECDAQFIGDRWCDKNNNREYCGWDGGDCCASTAKGKRSTCAHECDCKDPNAEENNPVIAILAGKQTELDMRNQVEQFRASDSGNIKIKARGSKGRSSVSGRVGSFDMARRKRKNRRREKLESSPYFDGRSARRKYRNKSKRMNAASRKLRRERKRSRGKRIRG
uniref:pappalysin-1-like n=1 Tax=Styela clava TaxID=7725 RepID=UPI00193A6F35|nr:pappalysin-1-like [Styela clava]